MAGSNCGTIDNRKDGSSNRLYTLLPAFKIMELQELLEMNIEIGNLINAPQVNLPPIIKGLVQKLINENEAKLEEISE
jgi:hypothetical protein